MASFVGEALQSALDQTYSNVEIIVCNNASTDNTSEVLSQYADSRLKVVKNETNIGAIGNFNRLIELSTGRYIKFLEADDILVPGCVEKMMGVATQNPNATIICCGKELMDVTGATTGFSTHGYSEVVPGITALKRLRKKGNEFGTPSEVLVKKYTLDKVGGFDTDYGWYLNDWDLWIRCAEVGAVAFIDEALAKVRRHENQMGATGQINLADIDVCMLFVKKRFKNPFKFGQQLHLYCHFSEEFFWRAVISLIRHRNKAATIYLGNTLVHLWRFFTGKTILLLIYFLINSPRFFAVKLARTTKRFK